MRQNETRKLKQNIVFNIIRTLFSVAYPIITFTYVARILHVDDMGSVTFIRNLVSYFSLFASLGVSYYGIRESARIVQNKHKFSKFFWEINLINFITTVISGILLFTVIFTVGHLEEYRLLLLINSVNLILCGFSNEWVLGAREEYKNMSVRSILIQLFCVIAIFIFIHTREDYIKYSAILVFSTNGANIFNWIYIFRRRIVSKIPIKELDIKRHLKPIFILFAMLVSIDLYTMLDTTMLGFMKGDYAVGIYNASIKIPRLVNSVIGSVGAVLVPQLSYYYDKDIRKFEELVNKAWEFIIFITVPAFFGIMMMSSEIIMVFAGEQYTDAFVTTRILAPIVLIIPISVLFNNQVFIPMRKEKFVLKSTCVGAVVNLVLNVIFIPLFAENGASIATIAAELSVMLVCAYHVKRELNPQNVGRKYIRAIAASLCIFFFAIVFKYWISNVYMRLFITVLVSALCYGALNCWFFLEVKKWQN